MADESTYIAKVVDSVGNKGDCDRVCKKVLATKEIAAHILKEVVPEYKDCDVDDIIMYISDIQISQESVNIDELPAVVDTDNTEDSTINEGKRFYDIKFKAKAPGKDGGYINLIINIEAQKDFSPGYSLLKRGIYYCARLISAQYETIFSGSEYDKLRKVYSIWISTNPDDTHKNTIVRYGISPEELFGNVAFKDEDSKQQEKQNYDMMSLIMICLDNYQNGRNSKNDIIKLLSILLSSKIEAEQKKELLEDECHIRMTKDVEEEIGNMCNLSQGYYENGLRDGFEKGIQEGEQKGRQEGRQEGFNTAIITMLKNGKKVSEIAKDMGMTVEEVERIESGLDMLYVV